MAKIHLFIDFKQLVLSAKLHGGYNSMTYNVKRHLKRIGLMISILLATFAPLKFYAKALTFIKGIV
jgi:hypothetical protein